MPAHLSTRALVLMVAVIATFALVLVAAPRGATALGQKVIQVTEHGTVANSDLHQIIASCPAGFTVTGGGYELESINPALFVHQDTALHPEANDGLWGWMVTVLNESGVDVEFTVAAMCLKD